ncbi:MAG: radical SAM protein [Chloroflexi bacterium]|nr:radical SAM protein [Chloroflexota bacterium]
MRPSELRVKVELLCWGIRPCPFLEQAYRQQNPYADKRTGNAGLQLLLANGGVIVNVPVFNRYNRHSPYELKKGDQGWYLERGGNYHCECDLVPAPQWYALKTPGGIPLSKILVQEGRRTLIAGVYNSCDYKAEERCLFCALGPYVGLRRKDPAQIRDATMAALKENALYHLHLTGGNVLPPGKDSTSIKGDRGMLEYVDVVRAIREVSDVPISIEASPPEDNEHMKTLVEAGANAFSINLEIWDDRLRKLFCPGKSIVPKRRYFEVWEYALGILGANMVASVLIGGPESKESTLRGAEEMARAGVVPAIIPLRRNDGSCLQNFASPSPDDMVWIFRRVGEMLNQYRLEPWTQPGCTACGACSVEQDYQNLQMTYGNQAS